MAKSRALYQLKVTLQDIFSTATNNLHVDVDKFNPYEDVVNFLGHAFVEVLPHLFRFKH